MTLFRRFGTKANLLAAAVRRNIAEFETGALAYTGDLHGDLCRLVETYLGLLRRHGGFVVAVFSELPRQPDLGGLLEAPMRAVGKVLELLARYQDEGRLVRTDPLLLAVNLLGPVFLAVTASRINPFLPEFQFSPDDHVRRYLTGHGAKGRPE